MRSALSTICLLLLLASNVLGQITIETTKLLEVAGVSSPQLLGAHVLVGEDSKPVLRQAALLRINTSAKFVQVKARKTLFDVAALTEVGEKSYLLSGEGRYAVEVTTFDPEKGIDSKTVEIVLGGDPVPPTPPEPGPQPPTPGPDIPIPDDNFDNLGRRVNAWAITLPKRKEVAAIYREAAKQLRENAASTVNTVAAEIVNKRNAILVQDVTRYADLVGKLNTELTSRWPMSKGDLASFFTAIAIGLEAGQ